VGTTHRLSNPGKVPYYLTEPGLRPYLTILTT
jgi:hypothetical protein